MNNFFKSFFPILKKLKLKKYFLEIILLFLASLITIFAFIIYSKNQNNIDFPDESKTYSDPLTTIFVDISGAVNKPDLYEFKSGTRIKEVVDKAGGLSDEVDTIFFKRNFNLARIVNDQEKIYIPSVTEVNDGIYIQNAQIFDYLSPATNNVNQTPTENILINNQLTNVNSATVEELDQLPGIGLITANKIIANRPYLLIEELVTKKTVNKSVFEKIKNLISI